MECYTWTPNGVSAGLELKIDDKLGQVVFLGEEGRGRRYEKIGLSRRKPAEVVNGRVMNANPLKITLPAQGLKPEKSFYVLEQPKGVSWKVLVRINTFGGYIRNGHGAWSTITGEPETIVVGHGAFGDATRLGGWDDGLVLMKPGDLIQVRPSRDWGSGKSALWVDENGQVRSTIGELALASSLLFCKISERLGV